MRFGILKQTAGLLKQKAPLLRLPKFLQTDLIVIYNRPPLRYGESMIPLEHQHKCATCGKILDMRDLGQVLSHGNYNETLGIYVCKDEEMDVPYQSSRKVGDPVEWTKDKKRIDLN